MIISHSFTKLNRFQFQYTFNFVLLDQVISMRRNVVIISTQKHMSVIVGCISFSCFTNWTKNKKIWVVSYCFMCNMFDFVHNVDRQRWFTHFNVSAFSRSSTQLFVDHFSHTNPDKVLEIDESPIFIVFDVKMYVSREIICAYN